jgi:capsular polysaccharide biosynthesis protein
MNTIIQKTSPETKKSRDINLKEVFDVMKRHIWVVLVVTILAAAFGIAKSMIPVEPLYQASSRIIIGADDQSRTTLQVIIKDSTVLDIVIKELKLKTTSAALANQISVASIDSSQVVSITVTNTNPEMAVKIADTTAKVFKDEVPKIVGKDYVRLLSNAKLNLTPINQSHSNKVLTYGIIGVVVGVGLTFLLDSFDNKLRNEKEIELLLGLPVLGKVSRMNKRNVQRKTDQKLELELRGDSIGFK